MMCELDRAVFLHLLRDWSIRRAGWWAVCVCIPPEHVHRRCAHAAESLIEAARTALLDAPRDGLFARIGWTSFFAIVRSEVHGALFDLEGVTCADDPSVRWHTAEEPLVPGAADLLPLFDRLEVAALDTARREP